MEFKLAKKCDAEKVYAVDMGKSITTIKDVMRELVSAQLLEKIPQG